MPTRSEKRRIACLGMTAIPRLAERHSEPPHTIHRTTKITLFRATALGTDTHCLFWKILEIALNHHCLLSASCPQQGTSEVSVQFRSGGELEAFPDYRGGP